MEESLRKEKGTQYLPIICLTIALSWMKSLMKFSWKRRMAKQVDYCTASKGLDQTAVVQADVALLLTFPSHKKNNKIMSPLDMVIFNYFEEENETVNTEFTPSLHVQSISHKIMASPLTDSSMPLVPSYYKEGYKTSTAVKGPENKWEDYDGYESLWLPELSWVEEEEYYEELFRPLLHNDAGEVFIKLEEEGTALRQDLDELHQELMQLMEKHGMAGEASDEKYELRMTVTKPARAEWGYLTNLSTFNTFPCNSFTMALNNTVFPIPSSQRGDYGMHAPWPPDSLNQASLISSGSITRSAPPLWSSTVRVAWSGVSGGQGVCLS